MSRLLSTVLVIGLLGGTAAAFAVTEGLKLQHTPITSTKVTDANTRAQWRSGNRKAMATIAKPLIQPEPSPWISRPARNTPTSGASALAPIW